MRSFLLTPVLAGLLLADGPGVISSRYSASGPAPTADPNSAFWKGVAGVVTERGPEGEAVAGHRTEIRSRWTREHLYFLFICDYQQLFPRPSLTTTEETNKLWEWDVAEIFIGSDFNRIRHYYELQVSPRGEWVDLDIDRDNPLPEGGWRWNSGFTVKARLDEKRKVWTGEFRIPLASLDPRPPANGNEMRVNFYRLQGPGPKRVQIAWQPTGSRGYHVPESFGRLRLEGR